MEEIKPAKPTRKPKNPVISSKPVASPVQAETQAPAPASVAEIAKIVPANQPEVKTRPAIQPELPVATATTENAKIKAVSHAELPIAVAKTEPVKQPETTAANQSGDWRETWGLPKVEGKTARELAEESLAQKKLETEAIPEIKTAPAPKPQAEQAEPEKSVASQTVVAETIIPKETSENTTTTTSTNDVGEAENSTNVETSGTFKSFLIPYVLLLLRDGAIHGYAIWERLMLMSIPGLNENDRVNIYRALRQLEKEGKIKSQWETTGTGPARRVYMLTNTGENFLKIWATGLRQYRQSLDFFFNLYTGSTLPNLLGNGLFAPVNHKSEGEK